MNLTIFQRRETRFHLAMIALLLLIAFAASGQSELLPPAPPPGVNAEQGGRFIPVTVGKEAQGWVWVYSDTIPQGMTAGPRLQRVLVSCLISSGWTAREKTVSIAFFTTAFQPLVSTPNEPQPGPDQRLINDLLANLAREGLLRGVDISKPGNYVQILGWSLPPYTNMVTDTRTMREPPRK